MYKQQMAMGGGMNPMGPPDPKKAFDAERQAIEMVRPGCSTACFKASTTASGSQHQTTEALLPAAVHYNVVCGALADASSVLLQLDHKWKLANIEEEAAQVLRRSLGLADGSRRRRSRSLKKLE